MANDKRLIEASWSAICILVSLIYLSGEVTKSVMAAIFVLVCMSLEIAGRRLAQFSVVVSVIAIIVSFGFPAPARWPDLAAQALAHFPRSTWAGAGLATP